MVGSIILCVFITKLRQLIVCINRHQIADERLIDRELTNFFHPMNHHKQWLLQLWGPQEDCVPCQSGAC